jgi:hypothetical protein
MQWLLFMLFLVLSLYAIQPDIQSSLLEAATQTARVTSINYVMTSPQLYGASFAYSLQVVAPGGKKTTGVSGTLQVYLDGTLKATYTYTATRNPGPVNDYSFPAIKQLGTHSFLIHYVPKNATVNKPSSTSGSLTIDPSCGGSAHPPSGVFGIPNPSCPFRAIGSTCSNTCPPNLPGVVTWTCNLNPSSGLGTWSSPSGACVDNRATTSCDLTWSPNNPDGVSYPIGTQIALTSTFPITISVTGDTVALLDNTHWFHQLWVDNGTPGRWALLYNVTTAGSHVLMTEFLGNASYQPVNCTPSRSFIGV